MRVVGFIVKGGVPAELLHGDLHGLRHLWSKPGEQFPPLCRVIVAQPCGILPAQRNDREPDVAGMMCHCVSDLRQDQRFICVSKQRVAPSPLGARPAGDIVHIVFPFGYLVSVVLQRTSDELTGVALCRRCHIVLVLEQPTAQREIPKEPLHQLLLRFCNRTLCTVWREMLCAFSGCHIAHIVVQVGGAFRASLKIRTLEYDPRHGASPPDHLSPF